MVDIRMMQQSDLDDVRDVDSEAFFAWAKGTYGDPVTRFRRTRDNVRACLWRDPQGCFVATDDGRVVGFILSRTWGGVGWFGTFGVLPDQQRRGIGKRLIAASLDYLRQEPQRVIGLETMAESASNLQLYLQLGFQLAWPTLVLRRQLAGAEMPSGEVRRWSAADSSTRARWLSELRAATGRIWPGLDYAKEIEILQAFDHGDTVVLCNKGAAVGLCALRLASGVEGGDKGEAKVEALALDPQHTNAQTLSTLLRATEALASQAGKTKLRLPVYGQHSWAVQQLLEQGYRVQRLAVRMLWQDTDPGLSLERTVDCSRWAG